MWSSEQRWVTGKVDQIGDLKKKQKKNKNPPSTAGSKRRCTSSTSVCDGHVPTTITGLGGHQLRMIQYFERTSIVCGQPAFTSFPI